MVTSLCIFCAAAANALWTFVEPPHGPGKVVSVIGSFLTSWSIAWWIEVDARKNEVAAPYDFDSLFFFLWPLAAPIYLFRTRGWEAMIPIGLFLLLQLGGFLFAAFMAYPHSVA